MHRRLTLAVMAVAALALAATPAFAQQGEYAGTASCKMCHNKPAEGAQWNQWHGTQHAKAFETLKTDAAKQVAEKEGIKENPWEAASCLKCHVTGYDEAKKAAPAKIKMEEGVGCETCHGPGGAHVDAAKKAMLKKNEPFDAAATINTEPTAEVCTTCHNPDNPTWKEDRYTTKDGKKVGFDFEQAYEKISHVNPKKAEADKQ